MHFKVYYDGLLDVHYCQVVILIGSSASAVDISRDIAGVAKEVHVASRSVADETYMKQPGYDNMWHHSMVKRLSIRSGCLQLYILMLEMYHCWFKKLIFTPQLQIECVCEDGTVIFRNGKGILADVIMHCTGYSSFNLHTLIRKVDFIVWNSE